MRLYIREGLRFFRGGGGLRIIEEGSKIFKVCVKFSGGLRNIPGG